MFPSLLLICSLTALVLSYRRDPDRTRQALRVSRKALLGMLPGLAGVVMVIGLALALIPPGALADLFRFHGLAGFALVSGAGALLTMPAPIAFPLAGSLLKQGVSPAALAAFITTLTMVGTVTAPMEVKSFGKRFTAIRQGLSFGLAILVGGLMGVLLK